MLAYTPTRRPPIPPPLQSVVAALPAGHPPGRLVALAQAPIPRVPLDGQPALRHGSWTGRLTAAAAAGIVDRLNLLLNLRDVVAAAAVRAFAALRTSPSLALAAVYPTADAAEWALVAAYHHPVNNAALRGGADGSAAGATVAALAPPDAGVAGAGRQGSPTPGGTSVGATAPLPAATSSPAAASSPVAKSSSAGEGSGDGATNEGAGAGAGEQGDDAMDGRRGSMVWVERPASYTAALAQVAEKAPAGALAPPPCVPFDEALVCSVPPLVLAEAVQLLPGVTASDAPWWTPVHDRCLLVGSLLHGLGNLDALRGDARLVFAASLHSLVQAQAAAATAGAAGGGGGDDPETARTVAALEALQAGPAALFAYASTLMPPVSQLSRCGVG
jgi:hypothetical protein